MLPRVYLPEIPDIKADDVQLGRHAMGQGGAADIPDRQTFKLLVQMISPAPRGEECQQ